MSNPWNCLFWGRSIATRIAKVCHSPPFGKHHIVFRCIATRIPTAIGTTPHKYAKLNVEELYKKLALGHTTFEVRDLSTLLRSWGYSDNRVVKQSQLLNQLEITLLPSIVLLPIREAVTLLSTYAHVGRLYPPVVSLLSNIILQNIETISVNMLFDLVLGAARLNDRQAAYLPAAVSRLLSVTRGSNSSSSVNMIIDLLYSLTVLQKLNIDTFLSLKAPLEKLVRQHGISVGKITRLCHVWNEVQLLLELEHIDPAEWRRRASISATPSPSSSESSRALLPWQDKFSVPSHSTPDSSFNHLELSRLLRDLNVAHKNEAALPCGHMIDILIPMDVFEPVQLAATSMFTVDVNGCTKETENDGKLLLENCKGVVVEYDGPSHFESYAKAELGPTAMKRRHLQAAGYKVINIPHWRLSQDRTSRSKPETVLCEYLLRLGLRLKDTAPSFLQD